MNKQLEEIKEALSKATPGPWKWETLQYQLVSDSGPVISAEIHYTDTPMLGWKESDANLISNAPEWLASLVSQVEEMQKTLEFYANAFTYDIEHLSKHGYIVIDRDGGKLARNTLQSLKGDKP